MTVTRGSIHLLHEEQTNHLVVESHLRHRHLTAGSVINSLTEAVWATDNKHYALAA